MLEKYPKASVTQLGGFRFEELFGRGVYANISAVVADLVNRYGLEKTNRILRPLGVGRLVFATDYPDNRQLKPEDIYNGYFEILDCMDFNGEEIGKICKINALRMMRI